jgi:type II secretory pathway pseudopilin PulG
LLVVISIIAILASLLLPALGTSLQRAKRIQCMSNMRGLQAAYISYAQGHKDVLVSANTTDGAWVGAGNTIEAITNGQLYSYINDIRPYRCPSSQLHLYHSFSINAYLNGEWVASGARRFSDLLATARTIVFVEECDLRGYLMGSFEVSSGSWIDYVAINHLDGDNFSFADGHMEYRNYVSPDTYGISGHGASGASNPDLQWIAARMWPQ